MKITKTLASFLSCVQVIFSWVAKPFKLHALSKFSTYTYAFEYSSKAFRAPLGFIPSSQDALEIKHDPKSFAVFYYSPLRTLPVCPIYSHNMKWQFPSFQIGSDSTLRAGQPTGDHKEYRFLLQMTCKI